jgi:hypothetical protein
MEQMGKLCIIFCSELLWEENIITVSGTDDSNEVGGTRTGNFGMRYGLD